MSRPALSGRRIGPYRVGAQIGAGGMGVVYRGEHVDLGRAVAIKVLHPRVAADASYVDRFRREARTLAALRHPHIVQIYDFGVADGQLYLVMESIGGRSLAERLQALAAAGKRFDAREAQRIITEVASALDYAHAHGVVHRDVKPSNILFGADGAAILGDFGLASSLAEGAHTHSRDVLGTLAYCAPEQAQSARAAVPASDVYSLGIVAYELLTGRVPFQDDSPLSVALQHMQQAPPPPSAWRRGLPAAVDAVILKALAKQPAERFASAGEFAQALVAAWSPESGRALPWRRPAAWASGALLLLIVAGGVLAALRPWQLFAPALPWLAAPASTQPYAAAVTPAKEPVTPVSATRVSLPPGTGSPAAIASPISPSAAEYQVYAPVWLYAPGPFTARGTPPPTPRRGAP